MHIRLALVNQTVFVPVIHRVVTTSYILANKKIICVFFPRAFFWAYFKNIFWETHTRWLNLHHSCSSLPFRLLPCLTHTKTIATASQSLWLSAHAPYRVCAREQGWALGLESSAGACSCRELIPPSQHPLTCSSSLGQDLMGFPMPAGTVLVPVLFLS